MLMTTTRILAKRRHLPYASNYLLLSTFATSATNPTKFTNNNNDKIPNRTLKEIFAIRLAQLKLIPSALKATIIESKDCYYLRKKPITTGMHRSRFEEELLRTNKIEFSKLIVTSVLFALPIVGYFTILVQMQYPKLLMLPLRCWTPEQRFHSMKEDFLQRSAATRELLLKLNEPANTTPPALSTTSPKIINLFKLYSSKGSPFSSDKIDPCHLDLLARAIGIPSYSSSPIWRTKQLILTQSLEIEKDDDLLLRDYPHQLSKTSSSSSSSSSFIEFPVTNIETSKSNIDSQSLSTSITPPPPPPSPPTPSPPSPWLSPEELRHACARRGLDFDQSEPALTGALRHWLGSQHGSQHA